jgi:3-deoxy-D-manno-octulosonate 8-phosphate phosphatase (KDO 8-P phosphatase)
VTPTHSTDIAGFQPALSRVRMLVLDVDGVLTDGRLFYGARGESLKVFHVRDGHGIKQVAAAGITVAIISGRKSAAVTRRARELGIRHVTQGASDKVAALTRLAKSRAIPIEHCACVGDDTPDAPMLRAAGVAIAVADAHRDALEAADLVTTLRGGRGAVREVCDWLLDARRARNPARTGVVP